MGLKCLKCGNIISGYKKAFKCNECGNRGIENFQRVPDKPDYRDLINDPHWLDKELQSIYGSIKSQQAGRNYFGKFY